MGQAHARSYMPVIYEKIVKGELDPTAIITHTMPLEQASEGYRLFNDKKDGCIKVVFVIVIDQFYSISLMSVWFEFKL